MKPLKLKKKDISQEGSQVPPKKKKSRFFLKAALWVTFFCVLSGGILYVAVYSALFGGRALFLKGCYNFRYDLFPVKLTQHDQEAVVFAAVGDIAVYKESYLPAATKTFSAIKRVCALNNCDFMVMLGDNISDFGVKSTESPLLKKYHEDITNNLDLPALVLVGNHDYRTNLYAQIAYSYKNKNWIMPNNEFLIRTPLADFFGINTNCDVVSYMKLERREFYQDKWNFVFGHHSLYSNGVHGDAPWQIRYYWNRYLSERADVHVSGHNHMMEYLDVPDQKTAYVVSGSGSSVDDSAKISDKNKKSAGNTGYSKNVNGFSLFKVTKDRVEISLYDNNGSRVFQKTLTKNNPG